MITKLVEVGLASDQNFPLLRELGSGRTEVTFPGAEYLNLALKGTDYKYLYDQFKAARSFAVLLPDGALLQLNYEYVDEDLERSRLAFLPSPYLEHFQADPELYLMDVVFAEVVAQDIVPFPLRFDFDAREGVPQELRHPKSHLTLGQYGNCRIPLTAPLPPSHFFDFILRNFYNTAFMQYSDQLPRTPSAFEDCILASEETVLHMKVPRRLYELPHQ